MRSAVDSWDPKHRSPRCRGAPAAGYFPLPCRRSDQSMTARPAKRPLPPGTGRRARDCSCSRVSSRRSRVPSKWSGPANRFRCDSKGRIGPWAPVPSIRSRSNCPRLRRRPNCRTKDPATRQLKLRICRPGVPCALFPPRYAKHSAGLRLAQICHNVGSQSRSSPTSSQQFRRAFLQSGQDLPTHHGVIVQVRFSRCTLAG